MENLKRPVTLEEVGNVIKLPVITVPGSLGVSAEFYLTFKKQKI